MTLHICFSRKDEERVLISKCPTCKRRTKFYSWFQEWYGWHSTCLNCGDRWTDGEMLERPFERGWRKENILRAKECVKEMRKKAGKL